MECRNARCGPPNLRSAWSTSRYCILRGTARARRFDTVARQVARRHKSRLCAIPLWTCCSPLMGVLRTIPIPSHLPILSAEAITPNGSSLRLAGTGSSSKAALQGRMQNALVVLQKKLARGLQAACEQTCGPGAGDCTHQRPLAKPTAMRSSTRMTRTTTAYQTAADQTFKTPGQRSYTAKYLQTLHAPDAIPRLPRALRQVDDIT